jgi:cell division septum initiation protein DivIVA
VDFNSNLEALEALLLDARPIPLSSSVLVQRRDVEELAAELRATMPEEIRRARWLLEERDEVLAAAAGEAQQVREDAQADAERVREQAAAEAARLVDEAEVLRTARREAERVVAEARNEARRLRSEADDYVDAKLADFEAVLGRTVDEVGRGRAALREGVQPRPAAIDLDADIPQSVAASSQFYDQERLPGAPGA